MCQREREKPDDEPNNIIIPEPEKPKTPEKKKEKPKTPKKKPKTPPVDDDIDLLLPKTPPPKDPTPPPMPTQRQGVIVDIQKVI